MTEKSVLGTMLVVLAQVGLQVGFQKLGLSWAQFSHSFCTMLQQQLAKVTPG